MKNSINAILVLMSLCTIGIIGLQLFWNIQNYKSTVTSFEKDINESLNEAVEMEMGQRRQQLITKFKTWLADTSFITVTCDTKNRDSATVFHFNDRHPKFPGSKGISFGVTDFHKKLNKLTPEAKKVAINQFGDKILRADLEKGIVYYYTQRLGDSLAVAFAISHVNRNALTSIYKKVLLSKGINTWFTLSTVDQRRDYYQTKVVNTDFERPFKKANVQASFDSPDVYFLNRMKWVILSTFVLITITLFCFGYTVKTLLSQQKLAELKDNFINNMTHELNTPLTSIKVTAEALKSFDQSPKLQKEYLEIISYQTDKLANLSSQILNTNKQVVANQKTWDILDLNTLVQKAIQDQRIRLDRKKATITYVPVEGAFVYGDASSLLNVFANIIDNSLKYTELPPLIEILIVKHRQLAELTFSDNGIGIPVEFHQMIFEPFFRIAPDKIHDVKGYGLGLSYVNQVIQQHKGSISVHPNQPGGSQFKIKIPLA